MKAYMIVYMDSFKSLQCVIQADTEEQATEKAENKGIKNIISVQYLNAYILL